MRPVLALVAAAALLGFSGLPWHSSVSVYGTGSSHAAAGADARAKCGDQLYALEHRCQDGGGRFVPEACSAVLCRNLGALWTCDGKASATCEAP